MDTTITNADQLPLAATKRDIARFLGKSERTVERYVRAGLLPEPVVPGRWSRDRLLAVFAGGSLRRGRR